MVIDVNGNVEVPSNHPSSDHTYSLIVPLSERPPAQSLVRVRALYHRVCTGCITFCSLGKWGVEEKVNRAGQRVGRGQETHYQPQEKKHWAQLTLIKNLQHILNHIRVYVSCIVGFSCLLKAHSIIFMYCRIMKLYNCPLAQNEIGLKHELSSIRSQVRPLFSCFPYIYMSANYGRVASAMSGTQNAALSDLCVSLIHTDTLGTFKLVHIFAAM